MKRGREDRGRAGTEETRVDSSNNNYYSRSSSYDSRYRSSNSTPAVAHAGVGTECHSGGALEIEAPAAGEAAEGMSVAVRQRSGVGGEVGYRTPPRGGYSYPGYPCTFPVRLVTSHRYMQLTLASDARPVTSWGTRISFARA